jgi:hypothetical protein
MFAASSTTIPFGQRCRKQRIWAGDSARDEVSEVDEFVDAGL